MGGGAIVRLVKESGKTMEGSDTTGFVLWLPNVERIFPLDNKDGDDDGGGIKGTAADGPLHLSGDQRNCYRPLHIHGNRRYTYRITRYYINDLDIYT